MDTYVLVQIQNTNEVRKMNLVEHCHYARSQQQFGEFQTEPNHMAYEPLEF